MYQSLPPESISMILFNAITHPQLKIWFFNEHFAITTLQPRSWQKSKWCSKSKNTKKKKKIEKNKNIEAWEHKTDSAFLCYDNLKPKHKENF